MFVEIFIVLELKLIFKKVRLQKNNLNFAYNDVMENSRNLRIKHYT